jgi:hypothetical protein
MPMPGSAAISASQAGPSETPSMWIRWKSLAVPLARARPVMGYPCRRAIERHVSTLPRPNVRADESARNQADAADAQSIVTEVIRALLVTAVSLNAAGPHAFPSDAPAPVPNQLQSRSVTKLPALGCVEALGDTVDQPR